MLTILFMALPSLAIGCLPTSQSFGEMAAVLLLVFRLMQGLALGGEIPAAITFVAEYVDPGRRGWALAVLFFGINLGLMLGSLISSMLSSHLNEPSILAWGWRVPFILGGLFGFISLLLRRHLHETKAFVDLKPEDKARIPFLSLIKSHTPAVIIGFFLVGIGSVTVFMFLYWPTYLSQYMGYDFAMVLRLNTMATLMLSVTILLGGWIGDRIGFLRVYLACAVVLILCTYPLFHIFTWKSTQWLFGAYLLFSFIFGFIPSSYSSLLSMIFPTSVRYSGVALSYNLAYALIGGLSPVLCTILIKKTGDVLAPAYYVMFISFLSACAAVCLAYLWRNKRLVSAV
jgi:MHS family proline/betaine transporter-like MFS transporter